LREAIGVRVLAALPRLRLDLILATRSVTILLRFTARQLRAVTWAAEIRWTTGHDAPWEPTLGRRFASI
jgi:hypothetical protein